MVKFAMYRLRLDPDIKRCLKDTARAEKTSIGRLLDRIAREWLDRREAEEEAEQLRLHAEAAKWIGSLSSGDRHRSQQVRKRVRAKPMEKRGRLEREAPGSRRR